MKIFDWKSIRDKAIAYAKSRGHARIAEDFAQEFLIETLKGRKASMEFVLIDFLRKEYGDSRTGRGRNRSFASLSFKSIIDESQEIERGFDQPSESYVRACIDYDRRRSNGERSIREAPILFGRSGLIIERLLEGETLFEIGFSLGITASRVCQIAKTQKEKLSKFKIFKEELDEYKFFPEKSFLFVDWITL